MPENQKPRFLEVNGEYAFVPIPAANVTFENNVKVVRIDYPWVLVEHVLASGESPQEFPVVWVNMDQVSVVKVV